MPRPSPKPASGSTERLPHDRRAGTAQNREGGLFSMGEIIAELFGQCPAMLAVGDARLASEVAAAA